MTSLFHNKWHPVAEATDRKRSASIGAGGCVGKGYDTNPNLHFQTKWSVQKFTPLLGSDPVQFRATAKPVSPFDGLVNLCKFINKGLLPKEIEKAIASKMSDSLSHSHTQPLAYNFLLFSKSFMTVQR